MDKKIKVLIIQEDLKNYREPIFDIVAQKLDLTIAYTFKTEIDNAAFKILKLPYFNIGPFIIHKNIYKVLNRYDVVIWAPQMKFTWLNRICFLPRKFKLISWSIGVYVSYNRHYLLNQKPTWRDKLYEFYQDRADACVFYMPQPIDYWKKYKKINTDKYFVAHNTVAVSDFGEMPPFETRKSFLFVGTLYSQKGLDELIDAYKQAKDIVGNLSVLNIIGKGPEKDVIEAKIKQLQLTEDVKLLGAIYDETILKDYFLDAILCISPKQAGLSVLKSFGYGTPFVTHTDAITGGEKNNIIDGYNGVLYDCLDDLTNILVDVATNSTKYKEMSDNARLYYVQEASPENMAQGFLDAVEYAMKHTK